MKNSVVVRLLAREDWGKWQPTVNSLRRWEGYPRFLEAMESLREEVLFDSAIHGPGHIERTLLHGAFCAMAEPLNEEDTRLLFLACCYHDVGRVDDSLDDLHGWRSAQRIQKLTGLTGEPLKLVQAAVDAHSRSDSVLKATLSGYRLEDPERGLTLALLLKDADGLDRVRIWDLDPRFLRREDSRRRAGFAKELYLRYQRETHAQAVPDFVRMWKNLDEFGQPMNG